MLQNPWHFCMAGDFAFPSLTITRYDYLYKKIGENRPAGRVDRRIQFSDKYIRWQLITYIDLTKYLIGIATVVLAMASQGALGQVEVRGTVYDRSQNFAMPGVSVLGTSGVGTMTDSNGHYSIKLPSTDSIYFSYLGKFTIKFSIKRIAPGYPLNMSLAVSVDSLPLVGERPKLYRYDSAENREEYRRVFEYNPDYIVGGDNGGEGFNLEMLFTAKRNRRMRTLQRCHALQGKS